MEELTRYIFQNITNYPDQVKIKTEQEGEKLNIEVEVHEEDMPRVIGKGGKVIRSIRNLLKVAAQKENLWINLKLGE